MLQWYLTNNRMSYSTIRNMASADKWPETARRNGS